MRQPSSSPSILFSGLLALSGVLAGLEHAKHSTKLDHTNFDAQIQVPEIGTLTAFFAPWCGHCKSLLGTWDTVAETFKTDSKCRVAHFDADESSNRDIAGRYSVTGFPTIKFLPKDSSKPVIDYAEARSPDAFIKFLNRHCGTQRASGGLLLPEAGRIASLDELITSFIDSSLSERPALIEKATKIAKTADGTMATYYIRVMEKVKDEEGWLTKEIDRLKKLAEKGATMATDKFEALQMKQNILQAFQAAKSAAKSVGEQAEAVVEKVKGEL